MDKETKKQPEVELDLDDAKETSVELKEKEDTKKAPNLNVGEVDLGYTTHDGKAEKEKEKISVEEIEEQPKVEAKVETKTEAKPAGENLEEYTESVKKRIDKLTYKIREAERREKAALEYAKGFFSCLTFAHNDSCLFLLNGQPCQFILCLCYLFRILRLNCSF